MQHLADVNDEKGCLTLSGEINFQNAAYLYQKSLGLMKKKSTCAIDFSAVTTANSAALALILEWIKYASKKQKNLQLKFISKELMAIASVASLDTLILPFVSLA